VADAQDRLTAALADRDHLERELLVEHWADEITGERRR
jgi:hypothetical protein